MTLAQLRLNQLAQIKAFQDGPEQLQLMELGFGIGKQVRIIHRAPFGFPIAVQVGQTMFSMRREEAELIHVEIER